VTAERKVFENQLNFFGILLEHLLK
jgi:hypothetical protein